MACLTVARTMESASILPRTISVHELRQIRPASVDQVDRRDKFDCLELLVQQSCRGIVDFGPVLLAGFLIEASDGC